MSKNSVDVAAIMKNAAESFVSKDVKSEVLPVGTHNVLLTKAIISTSFHNHDGSEKDKEYEWKDPTPVLIVSFVKDAKAILHRFNFLGYKNYDDDLTTEEKESGEYEVSEESGYALKDGKRVVSEKNTDACVRILSRLFSAVGLKPGSTLDDLNALIEKREAECTIVVEEKKKPDGGTMLEVVATKPIAAEAPVTGGFAE